ncbi:MAG: ABC transporter substrate-binding protein, partial [Dehalococcoidia bacterium]
HDAPNADFMEQLADGFLLWIAPTESDGKYDAAKKSIGSGPWIMDRYDIAQKFVYKRNPDYFVKDLPYMDGVEQAVIPEYANQMAQFQAGNIFNISPAANDVLPLRKQFTDLQWMNRTGTTMWGVFFAPKENDPTGPQNDERFRIAVSYAINRESLLELLYNIKALKDAGLTAVTDWNNQVSVGMGKKWWLNPKSPDMGAAAKYFEYNPAESKKLLSAMGLKSDTKIPYQYTHNRYGATFGTAAEAILGQLTEAGFPLVSEQQDYNSKFITQTWQGRFKGIALGNFGGFSSLSGYLGEQIDDNPENRRLLHTADMLGLKKKQGETVNEAERVKLVQELQKVNATNMYIVPTTGGGGTSYFAFRPQVRGIRDTRGLGGGTEQIGNYWLA